MQQIFYAQYGNPLTFYGNIQYGAAPKYFQVYGAWPEEPPPQEGMLVSDWQEEIKPQEYAYQEEISQRVDIIRRIKKEIETESDLKKKNLLREHMRIEREAKERAFRLKALVDEEESLFILLH